MQPTSHRMLSLYDLLRINGHEVPARFGCTEASLEAFVPHFQTALPPTLRRFLAETLPENNIDIGVFKTSEPIGLLETQLDAVPFYENMKNDFFGLGWWTGESDGDGWMFDLQTERIHAIRVTDGYNHDHDSLVRAAYLTFETLDEWIAYLELELRRRGWLD